MPSVVATPLHVQISKLQTAIGRAESTVKNRREQLWQSQQALVKAQDHLCELQRRLEEVMHQRKEEEDQGYDTMDLQDGFGSWWDADSPGLDDDEEHSREWSQHLGGPVVVFSSPGLAQVAVCSRGSVGQVCGDAEVHWQHHDAVTVLFRQRSCWRSKR